MENPNSHVLSSFHPSATIEYVLNRYDAERWQGLFRQGDREMTAVEAKAHLENMLRDGLTVIPLCFAHECPDFDYRGNGCPGHRE
jgi:hypothetical protein